MALLFVGHAAQKSKLHNLQYDEGGNHMAETGGDFQLYEYNIDVMENSVSVKCSFHFTTFTHASEQKASSFSSCTSIVFLTKLNYPYTLTFINDPTNINFDPNT